MTDWGTISTSALLSAGVSAIVAITTTGWRISRESSARRRDDARENLRAAAKQELNRWAWTHNPTGRPPRTGALVLEDIQEARTLLRPVQALGPVRRWWLHRALVSLFGTHLLDHADQSDSVDSDFTRLLFQPGPAPLKNYLYDQAQRPDATTRDRQMVLRLLRRLERGW